LVRESPPQEVGAEVEVDERGALGEVKGDGVVEEVVGKIEVGKISELAD